MSQGKTKRNFLTLIGFYQTIETWSKWRMPYDGSPLCIDMNVFLSTKNRRKAVLRRLSKKKIPFSVITDYGSAISNGEAGNPALL